MKRPWTIYPARPLTGLPAEVDEKLAWEFNILKAALRERGHRLYEFVGLRPDVTCEEVNDFDLMCVEMCDLLVALRPCAADGVSGEITWKCSRKEHVIAAAPKGCTVSRFTKGWRSRNVNFRYAEYDKVLDLIPIIDLHFSERLDEPKIIPPAAQLLVPDHNNPYYQRTKVPTAT